ncbi:MAG: SurA N-terminal domain-containing protein [Armatimonadota bacterium]|nr:SurA N-terminal domain-containing protein [bacterium]
MGIYALRTNFGHHFKWGLLFIALIFFVGAIWQFGVAPSGKNGGSPGGNVVVATVNGQDITRSDFDAAWEQASAQARERGIRSPLQYAELRAAIFQQMIQGKLILSAAEREGVDVSDRAVRDEVEKFVVESLKAQRQGIMGSSLTKKQAKLDPRKDSEYKKQLGSIGRSISDAEQAARAQIPEDQVRAKIAYEGISRKMKESIGSVTDKNVQDSYNAYKIRQILLTGLPKGQMKTRAQKILSEARGGADFTALAKANAMGPFKANGGQMEYTFDSRFMLPTEVRNTIEKMKPGGLSPAIETSFGTYIVKLEAVTPKLPAKLDKKTMDERRKQIAQDREMAAGMEFENRMRKNQDVKVTDPELRAYWDYSQAMQSYGDQAKMKKLMEDATSSLISAHAKRPSDSIVSAKLAQLLYQQGKVSDSITILYPMLEGKSASVEGADLRVLLGDMLVAKSQKDKPADKAATLGKAIKQYEIASEIEKRDVNIHQQLIGKFKQLGMADKAAAEQQWVSDYQKKMDAMKAEQQPAGRPAPKK